jgi:hypothetical protein
MNQLNMKEEGSTIIVHSIQLSNENNASLLHVKMLLSNGHVCKVVPCTGFAVLALSKYATVF